MALWWNWAGVCSVGQLVCRRVLKCGFAVWQKHAYTQAAKGLKGGLQGGRGGGRG